MALPPHRKAAPTQGGCTTHGGARLGGAYRCRRILCGELASCSELQRAVASCGELWLAAASCGELGWAGRTLTSLHLSRPAFLQRALPRSTWYWLRVTPMTLEPVNLPMLRLRRRFARVGGAERVGAAARGVRREARGAWRVRASSGAQRAADAAAAVEHAIRLLQDRGGPAWSVVT